MIIGKSVTISHKDHFRESSVSLEIGCPFSRTRSPLSDPEIEILVFRSHRAKLLLFLEI